MKRLRSILTIVISIILIVCFAKTAESAGELSLWNVPTDGGYYPDDTYYSISFAHLVNYNNVYCIQKGQSFPSEGKYMAPRYKIVISGNNAKIYQCDRKYLDAVSLVYECNGDYNNLLGAIVAEDEMGLGYGPSSGNYNNSQIALYYYWNDWLTESGASTYMSSGNSNKDIVNYVGQDTMNQLMETYKAYAEMYNYNATIYYMEPVFNSIQRLLIVERQPEDPKDINIPVLKDWVDNEQTSLRKEITVKLLANDIDTGKSLVLNESNDWKGEFTGLKVKDDNGVMIHYTVAEVEVPLEYISSIDGNMNDGFIIKNTLKPTEVKVIKVWEDFDNKNKLRPDSIIVTLYDGNNNIVTTDASGNAITNPVTLTSANALSGDSNRWEYTFTNLAKYKDGKEIDYKVGEIEVPTYGSSIKETAENEWTITNTYDGKTKIEVTKIWVDNDNKLKERPESITVKLLVNNIDTGKTLTLNKDNNWYGEFTELDMLDENGQRIEYSVTEAGVKKGYISTVEEVDENKYTITNSIEPTEINVEKIWEDFDNQYNTRPESIIITLYDGEGNKVTTDIDGNAITNPVTLTSANAVSSNSNKWTYTFTNLVKFKNGREIDYEIEEIHVPGYQTSIVEKSKNDITITNKYDGKTKVQVTKIWEDYNNKFNERPESILVCLLANGTNTGKTLTLNEANNWYGEFTELPLLDEDGKKIEYGVSEPEVKTEYVSKIEKIAENKYTITNSIEVIEIPVEKKWEDDNNRDGLRTDSIEVILYAKNVEGIDEEKVTLNANNQWKHTFTELQKYKDGNLIKYGIKENNIPEGYNATIIGNAEQGYTVINVHEPVKIDIPVEKIWDDDNDRERIRPNSIVISLYDENGKVLTDASGNQIANPITLSVDNRLDDNTWTYTFTNLYKYRNGKEIVYTMREESVPGYEVSIEKTENGFGYKITNTHKPQETEIAVKKVWEDFDNKYKVRPESVIIKLYANGVDTQKTVELNEDNEWFAIFDKLVKYEDGQEINYTIEEGKVPGYTTTIVPSKMNNSNGIEINGYIVTNKLETTSVSIEKLWDDDDNRDGLRTSSVKVTLFANGKATEQSVLLDESNGWKYKFDNLIKFEEGKEIDYTVKEDEVSGYEISIQKIEENVFAYKITNKHESEKIEIKVTKVWDDWEDLDDLRPDSVIVKLYESVEGGEKTESKDENGNPRTVELNENNNWTATFTDLYKYRHVGKEIIYEVVEPELPFGYECIITTGETIKEEEKEVKQFTITNKHVPYYAGYLEIKGTVWLDAREGKANDINGILDENDTRLEGIKVTLRDVNGNQFDVTSTTYTDSEGNYTLRVNYDNSKNVYKLYEDENIVKNKLQNGAYVEFEYDGVKYTTIKPQNTGANTSKATENEAQRNKFDNDNTLIEYNTDPNKWNGTISAKTNAIISYEKQDIQQRTETVQYCTGKGTEHTNPFGAWNEIVVKDEPCGRCDGNVHTRTYDVDVEIIPNINLGLFEKEQPYIALFSDLTKVEVEMNAQKYTYLYGIRSDANKNVGLQVKFQNENTYTYKRPVNPADIAYLNENPDKKMRVFVTYEITAGNLSTTLPIAVNSIKTYYDKNYILRTDGWTETEVTLNDGTRIKQATNNQDLNIVLNPQTEDLTPIQLRYEVDPDSGVIEGLLREEATLNYAVEINSYSTRYGENTLYAEQRTAGRTGTPYAGYDYDSHPGNVIPENRLIINNENRLEIKDKEPDEDLAPSFVLCKDKATTVQGTVWEDTNIKDNGERIGNGFQDTDENSIGNVKVELYDINGNYAQLYDDEGNPKDQSAAIQYTDSETGLYSFAGLVTGEEYFIKYTYGNDTSEATAELINATTINGTEINARDYKSTIITDNDPVIKNIIEKDYTNFTPEEKRWPVRHNDGYSVAVDNMLDRLDVENLKYSNSNTGVNMTAYTKPFIVQLEFDKQDDESKVDADSGDIRDALNTTNTSLLDRLDFGIIQRPHENLQIEKTITNFKIVLGNGQVLTQGNPNVDKDIDYVKTIGFGIGANNYKRLLVEMDAELIQSAELDLEYAITVTNNNEIDYDYGEKAIYEGMIEANIVSGKADSYIAKNVPNIKYYYYGNSNGLSPMKASIKFVDYIDGELVYREDTSKWNVTTATNLRDTGFISNGAKAAIENNGYYVLQSVDGTITLERTQSFTQNMIASKLLANKEENVFDNNAEIIEIDAKTARTVKFDQSNYIPGNYEPSSEPNFDEQDDDRVEVIITPPTGLTNNIITYIIVTLVGLLVICAGTVFIKKKLH